MHDRTKNGCIGGVTNCNAHELRQPRRKVLHYSNAPERLKKSPKLVLMKLKLIIMRNLRIYGIFLHLMQFLF